jgi:hypothetical protein
MPQVSQAVIATMFHGNMEQLLAEAHRRKHTPLKDAVSNCISSRYDLPNLLKALLMGCDTLRHTRLALLCIGDIGKLASLKLLPIPLSHSIPSAVQTLHRMLDPIDEELQLKLVQTLVALVSASDTREAYISQPLSTIFVLFCSSKYPIVQAACSATITQTSHALLNAFYTPPITDASTKSTPSTGATASAASTPDAGRMSPLGGQLLAASYYKDVCALCAGLMPKWIRLDVVTTSSAAPPATPQHHHESMQSAVSGGPSSSAFVIPMSLKFLLLDVLAQHLVDSRDIDPESHSPLLTQCLNEDLVTLALTCSAGGPHGPTSPSTEGFLGGASSFQESSDFFTRLQRVAIAALVHARKCMRHTAPAIINHHTMLVLDAASYPWKMAIVLSLWRKHLSDFTVLEQLLEVGRESGSSGADGSTSGSVSPQRLSSPTATSSASNRMTLNPIDDDSLRSPRPLSSSSAASSQPTSPHNPGHHILPLVTLVQAAASLLNHIVEAGCTSPVACSSVSPRNRARSLPSGGGASQLSPSRTNPSHSESGLPNNNSFSTLSNTLDIETNYFGGSISDEHAPADFQSVVSVVVPEHSSTAHGGGPSGLPHPATELVGTVLDFITMVTQSLARSLDVSSGAMVLSHDDDADEGGTSSSIARPWSVRRHRHGVVMQALGPKLLQSCDLAMRHLVGEDIIHSVLKCATHCIHCCSVLKIDSQRDAFLSILAQQIVCSPSQQHAAAEHHNNTSVPLIAEAPQHFRAANRRQSHPHHPHSRGNSPTQQPPVVASANTGTPSTTPVKHLDMRSPPPPPPLRRGGSAGSFHSLSSSVSGSAFSRNAVREFLSNSEQVERRVLVLSTIISIASAMGARLGRSGWRIVIDCFLMYSELMDEVPRLHRRASHAPATSLSVNASHNNVSGSGALSPQGNAGLAGSGSAGGSGGGATPGAGWVGMMSQGATQFFYGAPAAPSADATGAALHSPHASPAVLPPSTGGVQSTGELQQVIDSLIPLQDAISDVFRSSSYLPDEALAWVVRALVERSLASTALASSSRGTHRSLLESSDQDIVHRFARAATNDPTMSSAAGGVATRRQAVDTSFGSRVRFASNCLTMLLVAHSSHQPAATSKRASLPTPAASPEATQERLRMVVDEASRFYKRLFLHNATSPTDALHQPDSSLHNSPHVVGAEAVTSLIKDLSTEVVRAIINDICSCAGALLRRLADLQKQKSITLSSAEPSAWLLAPLELLDGLYIQLAREVRGALVGGGASLGGSVSSAFAATVFTEGPSHILRSACAVVNDVSSSALPSSAWEQLVILLGHSCDVGELVTHYDDASQPPRNLATPSVTPSASPAPPMQHQTRTADLASSASGSSAALTMAAADDIMFAFRTLESVQHTHLQFLDPGALEALIRSGERFMLQRTTLDKMSVNLSAVQLLWSVGDFLVGDAASLRETHGVRPASPSSLDAASGYLWSHLLDALRNGCLDIRQEVRHAAVKSLFSLVVTHGSAMPGAFWTPFLSSTLKVLMETVRAAIAQREVEVRSSLGSPAQAPDHPPKSPASPPYHAAMATPPRRAGGAQSAQAGDDDASAYALTPNRRLDDENPVYREHLSSDCLSHPTLSAAVVQLVEYLAVHPKQLDETRILLLEFISRLFRIHHGAVIAALLSNHMQQSPRGPGMSGQSSANASFIIHGRTTSTDTTAFLPPSGPLSGAGSNNTSSAALHMVGKLGGSGGASRLALKVVHDRIREFLALCGTVHARTWDASPPTSVSSRRGAGDGESAGLPEEVSIATVKAIFSLIGELLPQTAPHSSASAAHHNAAHEALQCTHLLDVSDVDAAWSVLESIALSAPCATSSASHHPTISTTNSASITLGTSKVLALVVESLGGWVLGAVKQRHQHQPQTLAGADGSQTSSAGLGGNCSTVSWYPTQFIATYLQRLVGVWDAASQSKASLMSYFYPSPVQASLLSVAQQFIHGPMHDAEWHTVCGFLVGQLPSRLGIEKYLLHNAAEDSSHNVKSVDVLPPLGVHLNYVQRVAQLLFEGVTVCSPWVSSWLAPLVLRPIGCLVALSLVRRPATSSSSSSSSYRLSVPAGFYDELMSIVETLCWGVVFQRSATQRNITARSGGATTSAADNEQPSSSLQQRSASQATKDLFSRDATKRRDFLHSYTSMLGNVISIASKVYEAEGASLSEDAEEVQYIEMLVRWVGELIQDCVIARDTLGASELLAALVPASSLSPAPLRRITRSACLVMNLWAAGDRQPQGPPSAVPAITASSSASCAPSGAAVRPSTHQRTESTVIRLQEATDTISSLQSIARTTMGSRNRGVVEAYLEDPNVAGNRELLLSALSAMGPPTSTKSVKDADDGDNQQQGDATSEEDRAALRVVLPLLLELIPLDDKDIRCRAADAIRHTLVTLGVVPPR